VKCPECKKEYVTAAGLDRHRTSKHGAPPAITAKFPRTAEGNCEIRPNPSGDGFIEVRVVD
jgi:hypothetical protein